MMKKRIMFMVESMMVGGAERVLINLVNSLDSCKFDITVISVFKNGVYPGYPCVFKDSWAPHVTYKYLVDNDNPFKYRMFNMAFNRGSKRLLHQLLVGESYDVEIAWYEGLPTTFLAHSSNRHSRKLAWLHYGDGFAHLTPQQRKGFLYEYNQYDEIVGVSDGVCRNFRERLGVEFPLKTCYNILDDKEILHKAGLFTVERNDSLTFVSVGRLVPVKGYDRLVKACARLKQDGFDFRLWLIGEGSEHDALQEMVRTNGLEQEVQMLGNQDNPYPYMKAADWFVSASYVEAFGMAILEAMILDTPAVATRCVGTTELLGEHGEYGLMTENSDEALYQAMNQVLAHPELRADYSARIRQRRAIFQKEELVRAVEAIL